MQTPKTDGTSKDSSECAEFRAVLDDLASCVARTLAARPATAESVGYAMVVQNLVAGSHPGWGTSFANELKCPLKPSDDLAVGQEYVRQVRDFLDSHCGDRPTS